MATNEPPYTSRMMYLVGNGNQERCSFDFSLLSFDEYKPFFNGLPNFIFKKCKHIRFCNDFYYDYKKDGRHSKRREQIIGASIMYNHPPYLQYLTKIIKRVVPKSLHLETLEFSNIKIPSKYINTICHAVANSTSVINVIFSDVPLGDRGFNELMDNVSPYQIQTITINNGGLTAKVTDMVREFLNKRPHNACIVRSIKEINIKQEDFPPEELEIIRQMIAAAQKDDDDWDTAEQWESRALPQTEFFESSTVDFAKRPVPVHKRQGSRLPDIETYSDSSNDNLVKSPKSSHSHRSKKSRSGLGKLDKSSESTRRSSIMEDKPLKSNKSSESESEDAPIIKKAPQIPIPVNTKSRDLKIEESISVSSSEEKDDSSKREKEVSEKKAASPAPVKASPQESPKPKESPKASPLPSPKQTPKQDKSRDSVKEDEKSYSYENSSSHEEKPPMLVVINHDDVSNKSEKSDYSDNDEQPVLISHKSDNSDHSEKEESYTEYSDSEEVHSLQKEGVEEISIESQEHSDNKVVLEVDDEVIQKSINNNNNDEDKTTFTTEVIEEYEEQYTFVTEEPTKTEENSKRQEEKSEKSEKSQKSEKSVKEENNDDEEKSASSSSSSKSSSNTKSQSKKTDEQSESVTVNVGEANTCKPDIVELGVPETGA